jgi:hypothetical protein
MEDSTRIADIINNFGKSRGVEFAASAHWDAFHEQHCISIDISRSGHAAYQRNYGALIDTATLATKDNFRIVDHDSARELRLIAEQGEPHYDAIILHDFTQEETLKHREFYRRLAKAVNKSTFLPADEVGLVNDVAARQWFRGQANEDNPHYVERCKDLFSLVNHLVIPRVKLAVIDLGHVVGSEDVIVPLGRAQAEGKYVVFVAPTSYHVETVREVLDKTAVFNMFGRKHDYPEDMLESPYVCMYKKGFRAPLEHYKRLWEFIRYDNDTDCFAKLGESAKKFFEANP